MEEAGDITNARQMEAYRIRDLLADILVAEPDVFDVAYYASEIRMPNGYQPSAEVVQHVTRIREYTRKWVPMLMTQNITYVKAGYLKVKTAKECRSCRSTQEVLQEKGVDVRIATDMLEEAFTGQQSTVVLVSSDTDLCPALHKIKARGVKIIYVCFADAINRAVSAVASQTLTIPIPKVRQYYRLNQAETASERLDKEGDNCGQKAVSAAN